MKKLLTLFLILTITMLSAQQKAYGDGEWLKFRIHYGLITAGTATLEVNQEDLDGKQVFHIEGFGETTGMTSWFFPVEDDYQSYVDIEKDIPYKFIRKIDEGGHTKDIIIEFNHDTQVALIKNLKHNTEKSVSFPEGVQDMVSSFYYLRNNLDVSDIKVNDEIELDMFFDKENYKFKLKFLGRETIDTEFGKVPCLIFRPYVQSGRVFKEKESLTLWVSDDENRIPLVIQADLMVGSLKATLIQFKGLSHSFKLKVD
ncbi:MAG: ATP-dependent exonuclease [Flavobacterium sp.]|nr:MAG: ATP-dependent exonuclease [Flavobacterium sp.]